MSHDITIAKHSRKLDVPDPCESNNSNFTNSSQIPTVHHSATGSFLSQTSPGSKNSMASTNSEPVYFWREFETPYGFFSQWYESAFEVDGVTYQSAEMWMMVQKAKLFGDEVRQPQVRGEPGR